MNKERKITVLLADDHPVVRKGFCELLKNAGGFDVIGQAGNGRVAVAMAKARRPDVIILDISMPVLNGLEAMRQILADQPSAKILIVSAQGGEDYIQYALEAGAAGLVPKHSAADRLAKTIAEIAAGKSARSPLRAPSRDSGGPILARRGSAPRDGDRANLSSKHLTAFGGSGAR